MYILIAAILTSSYFHIIKPLVNKYGALTTFSFTLFFGTAPMLFWVSDVYSVITIASSETLFAMLWLSNPQRPSSHERRPYRRHR